MISKVIGTF